MIWEEEGKIRRLLASIETPVFVQVDFLFYKVMNSP